tara:strand:- start:22784 stop:23437 length:654 start_codon:yes stop_codon:yes gene_type:complete
MNAPTLSLCITCYDGDYHLLNKLLNECKKQTIAPNDIIISSSGMKKENLLDIGSIVINSCEVPITHINQEIRHSEGQARNYGAEHTKMDLIQFFDVDDVPHPKRVEFAKKIFEGSNCDALVHSYKTDHNKNFDTLELNNDKLFECWWKPDTGLGGGQLKANEGCKIAHGPITIKPNISKKIKYDFDRRAADCKFCGKLMKENYKVFYYDAELMHYNL